jgi:hypothetical protein
MAMWSGVVYLQFVGPPTNKDKQRLLHWLPGCRTGHGDHMLASS